MILMTKQPIQAAATNREKGKMADDLTCAVCSEAYAAGNREPVMLPVCGHTFCRLCLFHVEGSSSFNCPTCRAAHAGPSVVRLPTVYALLNLAESYRKSNRSKCSEHGSTLEFWCRECREPLCGHCLLGSHVREGHQVVKAKTFVDERSKEISTRGAQLEKSIKDKKVTLVNNIKNLITRITICAEESELLNTSVEKAYGILKDNVKASSIESVLVSSSMMDSLVMELHKLSLISSFREENGGRTRCKSRTETEVIQGLDRQESISEVEWQVLPVEETEQTAPPKEQEQEAAAARGISRVASLENSREANLPEENAPAGQASKRNENPSNSSIEGAVGGDQHDTPKRNETPWPLKCCVITSEGRNGRLKWENNSIHMYALAELTDAHFMFHMSLLQSLIPSDKPEVFMDLRVDGRILGRIYIRLQGHLRRAQHFLALCLGTLGPSYRGSKFHGVAKRGAPGETLAGGRYITPEGTSGKGLMKDLEWGGKCMQEKAVGRVVGASGGKSELDAFFHICTRDHEGNKFACSFGQVVSGMEVVHSAVRQMNCAKSVIIADTGVTIPSLLRQ